LFMTVDYSVPVYHKQNITFIEHLTWFVRRLDNTNV
jgi:hypothetical protein